MVMAMDMMIPSSHRGDHLMSPTRRRSVHDDVMTSSSCDRRHDNHTMIARTITSMSSCDHRHAMDVTTITSIDMVVTTITSMLPITPVKGQHLHHHIIISVMMEIMMVMAMEMILSFGPNQHDALTAEVAFSQFVVAMNQDDFVAHHYDRHRNMFDVTLTLLLFAPCINTPPTTSS